ncbi:hypothetical protein HRR83_003328 [Exophiala dermatitidis]|uniref:MFS transporter, DHA1 family, multidrug resistance protein n=2 Tax=Exophiala dermatitidis TaxID=5970 RepID=H6BMT0_EXODN|nr:MFS transporter, DHA1 family, multidrug resistance protein [Exophiala dermatitidis NIH/UT8656]KAJ4518219.1 hypothetical protein HRR74_004514 [Exophiala dermatitidis]EHY52108.1 MFS transporter, DHA1 family, multidrug resistance protein [Exophiala dermatitidis NIH/UT8656]KAJ4521117.1 hypothetical protein HRR73_003458 [Exophiala dermatitidis]KAJ4547702.1 hypothetical protein HRR76_000332 [Exophiala dermatitidis]KAJ4553641.1 hypothetical protein HRR77_002020 [Exophiala dermatitidis]
MATPGETSGEGVVDLPTSLDTESHSLYHGRGTLEDPYIVEFLPNDPSDPLNWSAFRKCFYTALITIGVFAVTLTSSAYSASAEQIIAEFHTSSELFALGIALYVLGFAVGPPLWAPMGELYGRRRPFIVTHVLMVAFVGATAGCKNIASLLVFRFLAGTFAASPLTNSGGVIADLFSTNKRGAATCLFAVAPFMGPVLGPIIGGFITITIGWRWVQGFCCIFIGVVAIVGTILLPETYGPVLLRRKARQLSRKSKKVYISTLEKTTGGVEAFAVFSKTMKRPWVLLFREPIVFIASIYLSILYATIYMFLPAFPIIYERGRGWNAGIGSLPFLGIAVGMGLGVTYVITDDQLRYQKLGKSVTPESRLPPAMVGAVFIPIGMFGFAWTNYPTMHWSASVVLAAPFGFGCVAVFTCILIYLVDSYTIYAASVMAATAMLRSFIGAAFPLFTTQMFTNLGIHWASSIPAFLTAACLPFPFVMYRYGPKIRMKCKYAHEAAMLMAKMQAKEYEEPVNTKVEEGAE